MRMPKAENNPFIKQKPELEVNLSSIALALHSIETNSMKRTSYENIHSQTRKGSRDTDKSQHETFTPTNC